MDKAKIAKIIASVLCSCVLLAQVAPKVTPSKTLPDRVIAQFWRAKTELSTADNACRNSPDYTAAKAKFDTAVVAIRNFCGTDGIFGPDGDPACPPPQPPPTTPTPTSTPGPKEPSKK